MIIRAVTYSNRAVNPRSTYLKPLTETLTRHTFWESTSTDNLSIINE